MDTAGGFFGYLRGILWEAWALITSTPGLLALFTFLFFSAARLRRIRRIFRRVPKIGERMGNWLEEHHNALKWCLIWVGLILVLLA